MVWNGFCVTVCSVLSVCVLFWYSVKLGIFDNLLLIMLSYGQHILIFNISLNVFNIYFPRTIIAHFTFMTFLINIFLNKYFSIFTLIIEFFFSWERWPNWRWFISLWACLCCWNATGNRISTNLRLRSFIIVIFYWTIFIRVILCRLCHKCIICLWIFMFLTFIAYIIICNLILFFRIGLTQKIILLVNKVFWLRNFMRIFLWFHNGSLFSTSRIDLTIELSYILWLGVRPLLHSWLPIKISAIYLVAISTIFIFEVNLCWAENRISILILLFGIASGHDLVILALKLHLLYSLLLDTI